jgi:hypothetical protein
MTHIKLLSQYSPEKTEITTKHHKIADIAVKIQAEDL